jgi:CARDB protein/putative metal-binding protein
MKRRLSSLALVAMLVAVPAGLTRGTEAAHAAGADRADLVVTRASTASRTIAQGGQIAASWVLENRGRRQAQKSTTRVLLSSDLRADKRDILLGTASERALRARGTRKRRRKVTVPANAKPGLYRLLICADASKRVDERNERNNCRPNSGEPVRVRELAVAVRNPAPGGFDRDGDGYDDSIDCAPTDASINPGAVDTPNDGIDQNCDGSALTVGAGKVQVTLTWDNEVDMDLHVTEPDSTEIWFKNRGPTTTGGQLDRDDNVCTEPNPEPGGVENIFWPNESGAPAGTYNVSIVEFGLCGQPTAANWILEIRVGGQLVRRETGRGGGQTFTFTV